jgi:hypothetical protein
MASALVLGPAPHAAAALLPLSLPKILPFNGSAANTITSLEFINDVTLAIEAEQVGYMTNFGNFTGHFSYTAVATPATILLVGNATLVNDQNEQLFVTATVLEVGTDYPKSVAGTLTVTGGTGRFAGATGTIAVSGVDDEPLTDVFQLNGTVITSLLR